MPAGAHEAKSCTCNLLHRAPSAPEVCAPNLAGAWGASYHGTWLHRNSGSCSLPLTLHSLEIAFSGVLPAGMSCTETRSGVSLGRAGQGLE